MLAARSQCNVHGADKHTDDAYAWVTQAVFDGFVLALTTFRVLVTWRDKKGILGFKSAHLGLTDIMFRDGTPSFDP